IILRSRRFRLRLTLTRLEKSTLTPTSFTSENRMRLSRPSTSYGILWQHNRIPHRCGTGRQCRSVDRKTGHHQVFEYSKGFSPSSTSWYRILQTSAGLDIVLRSKAQFSSHQPYLSQCLPAYVLFWLSMFRRRNKHF